MEEVDGVKQMPVDGISLAYADPSERDHEILMKAVRAGRLEVFIERD